MSAADLTDEQIKQAGDEAATLIGGDKFNKDRLLARASAVGKLVAERAEARSGNEPAR